MTLPSDLAGELTMGTQMTPEQIMNFRVVLLGMIGPVALLMSKEKIISIRDAMQTSINRYEAAHMKALTL